METESSQNPSPSSSSSTPPQNSVERFIGSFVTLISNYGLRYQGILYYLNVQNTTLGLQNVICYGPYGTEGRNNNGFPIYPCDKFYDYILFGGGDIKEIIVTLPTSFTTCGLAKGTTCNKSCHATKPPLPLAVSSNNGPGAKKLPLTSNEKLIKQQATIDSNVFPVNGSALNDGFNIASQPQFPGSNFYDPYVYYHYVPYGVFNQAPVHSASSSNLPDSSASEFSPTQSFFTTFPPELRAPGSKPQNYGGTEFDAMNKNFIQYNLWGPPANMKGKSAKHAYNIDGSSYTGLFLHDL